MAQLQSQSCAALRPEVDAHRRHGRFLLPSSATGALLCQPAESLAGRGSCVELTPLLAAKLVPDLALQPCGCTAASGYA